MPDHGELSAGASDKDHRRVAAGQFERANQVFASGNPDYAIQLLLNCCKMDPGNLIYRKTLRKAQMSKHKDKERGSALSFLTNSPAKTRLKAAKAARDYLHVLEWGEEILGRNPWDVGAQFDMAQAADALGFLEMGVWLLEQAHRKDPKDLSVNRALARLYEKGGQFTQAIALWDLIRQADPGDSEAQHKGLELAAHDTIARGNYENAVEAGAAGDRGAMFRVSPEAQGALSVEDRTGREAAAIRKRIEADPGNTLPYLQLATIYRRVGQVDKALAVLNEGLIPTSNAFEIATEIAELETEPFRKNLAVTEQKIHNEPENEDLRKLRVQLLREINSRELSLFRHKSERFPNDMNLRTELGIRLLRAGQTDAAIIELQAARSDPRTKFRALQYLGYCFKSRNNVRLAQRNFEEALQALPQSEEATRKDLLYLLATMAAEAGDIPRALELGYDLANLDFGFRDIGKLLDEWQAKTGKG